MILTDSSIGMTRSWTFYVAAQLALSSHLRNLLLVGGGYLLGDRWGQTAGMGHWTKSAVVVAAAGLGLGG